MRKTKSQKGITLIALIITIIVLLILAVVAIGAVQNDGIIEHAKNARDEYGRAQDNENTTLENYLSKIEGNLPGGNTVGSEIQVTIDGTKVTLTKENFGEYLGKKVTNYKTGETETVNGGSKVSTVYRLYYIDFENKYGDGAGTIYLKADDCSNVCRIDNNYEEIPEELTENLKIKNLNPSLYAKGVTPPESSNSNMKAVNWLTNTTNWDGLKTSGANTEIGDKVNYVVGSPSLEMMMDSYNKHYNLAGEVPDYTVIPALPDTTRKKLFYKYTSEDNGYQVGPNARIGVEYAEDTSYDSVKSDSEIDTMYYGHYWLASPSVAGSERVYAVSDMRNFVVSDGVGSYLGEFYSLCPLVSLQTDVSLELE